MVRSRLDADEKPSSPAQRVDRCSEDDDQVLGVDRPLLSAEVSISLYP